MKILKSLIIGMAILGIIASIGIMIIDKEFSHMKTLGIAFTTIAITLNIEKIINYIDKKTTKS
ncbi:MAG: hypothetical protein ABFS16_16375 [Bacteroidota bacterium]